MEKTLTVGKTYTVTTASECSVTDSNGLVLCTAAAGEQKAFVATTPTIIFSDDSASVVAVFKGAPALGSSGGGGVSITFDSVPTADSTNAVTSGGVYTDAVIHTGGYSKSVAVGELSQSGRSCTAVGYNADAYARGGEGWDWYATAVGVNAYTDASSATSIGANSYVKAPASVSLGSHARSEARGDMAIGASAQGKAGHSIAFGYNVKNEDSGTAAFGVWTNNEGTQTLLYLMGAGSPLSTTYEGGEACMGYVVKDTSGNVSACGTQKLSALFPNNTAWATMALGLDDETPTPFLPTGATDPIVFPEIEDDLTGE